MSEDNSTIQHVSDTSLWVAYYRGLESDHPNPLFHDPLAKILIEDRGQKIAESLGSLSKTYTHWMMAIRTYVIDRYILKLVSEGVDTVINLGAGMDTRPYRLNLPSHLKWIEVDYPHVIEHKQKKLHHEKPTVQLERISLDLADQTKRKDTFEKLGNNTKKALILTEGVIPYLTEAQTASLALDLYAIKSFHFWIAEYYSPDVYRYFKTWVRTKKFKNAPFQFFPKDWFHFFKQTGWILQDIQYLPEEGQKLNRPLPLPWWSFLFLPFLGKKRIASIQKQLGYVLFTKTHLN